MQLIGPLFLVTVVIVSVIIHELSHGYAAEWLGDPTARLAGRLTLNPLKHLDLYGSLLVPAVLALFGGFIIGWAKPVPYNPYNLRGGKWGPAYVAAAGPIANLLLVLIFSLIWRWWTSPLILLIIEVNIMLAVFNLIPVPPLDGSKILFSILPYRWRGVETWFLRNQLWVIIILLLLLLNTPVLETIVLWLLRLFTGA